MSKVDLAREERLSKYDQLIEIFMNIYNQPRINKILSNNKNVIKK
jgi:hypothetical protein